MCFPNCDSFIKALSWKENAKRWQNSKADREREYSKIVLFFFFLDSLIWKEEKQWSKVPFSEKLSPPLLIHRLLFDLQSNSIDKL